MIDSMQRLFIFNVGGQRFALDLQHVAEVLDPPIMFPVPWAPAWLAGAMNFHGSLVAVLDLAGFMDIGTAARDGNVLVLDRRIANLALRVDGVENIVFSDVVLEEDKSVDPLVDKVLITADGEIRLLAVGQLLERIEDALRR